jgi:choline dehydrogenase
MNEEFPILRGKSFTAPVPGTDPEPAFQEWQEGKGLYTSNGVVLSVTAKSKPERPKPDLFIFGVPIRFTGYYPGYSRLLDGPRNFFTWAILKSHTNNTAGDVRLRSSDPRDRPEINFRYFGEGNDDGEDLEAVVTGIEFARSIMDKVSAFVRREAVPGEPVQSRGELRKFVRDQAWGHHSSCTCRMASRTIRCRL